MADEECTHKQIRSNHPHKFRSGTWACIYDTRTINGREQYLVAWPDWAFDYWLVDDPDAGYEFRDCEILKGEAGDTESEARTPSEDSSVG